MKNKLKKEPRDGNKVYKSIFQNNQNNMQVKTENN